MELLEIILPILFAVGYFIVAVLNKGSSDKESGETSSSESPELSQREQEIQEEIRRKIQERSQRSSQAEAPVPQETASSEPYQYDPNKPESQQRRVREQVKRFDSPPPVPEESAASGYDQPAEEEPPPLQPAWQRQTTEIEDRLRKQQQEIDAMQRRAEELQRKAGQQTAEIGTRMSQRRSDSRSHSKSRSRSYSGSFQREVIESLKDPRGFKKALLSYEILGSPVGLRQDDKMGPLWKNS